MEGHSKLLLTILFIYNFLLVLENTNTNRKLALQLVFTFIALSLLFGHQEELPVCKKIEVLALSVWSKVQMLCIWSSWCHCHPI